MAGRHRYRLRGQALEELVRAAARRSERREVGDHQRRGREWQERAGHMRVVAMENRGVVPRKETEQAQAHQEPRDEDGVTNEPYPLAPRESEHHTKRAVHGE